MIDEGYIKFNCDWDNSTLSVSEALLRKLNDYRDLLVKRNMIGKIHDGPGFGNISVRYNNGFLISGSDTGHLKTLTKRDIAFVTSVDVQKNKVFCVGETIASSESMSHAVIYNTTNANAVIHIHHNHLWKALFIKSRQRIKTLPMALRQWHGPLNIWLKNQMKI